MSKLGGTSPLGFCAKNTCTIMVTIVNVTERRYFMAYIILVGIGAWALYKIIKKNLAEKKPEVIVKYVEPQETEGGEVNND